MSAPSLIVVATAALALGLTVVTATQAVEGGARASGAADAAALAASDATLGWVEAPPCEVAELTVQSFGAVLNRCDVNEANGGVRIRVSVQTIFGNVYAHARAGPSVA